MIYVFLLCGLASSLSARSLDPLVTLIARDFSVPVATAALMSSAYAFPFSFSQPVLGPLGDFYGKSLVLKCCIWMLAFCLVGCALAPSFPALLSFRLLGGMAAGGIMPIAMAIIGDSFPPAKRQLAIGRFLTSSLTGLVFGASIAGIMAVSLGWRSFLWFSAAFTLICAVIATIAMRGQRQARTGHISLGHAIRGYATVFANPKAILCFGTVFLEGISVYGALPFIVGLLESSQSGSAREAGFVLGAMGLGGIAYSLSLPITLRFLRRTQMMAVGGVISIAGLVGLMLAAPWPVLVGLFFITGFGFFLLHNSVQTEVSELSPGNRGSAFAMHSFSFFLGQAIGPVICGLGLSFVGRPWLLVNIVIFAATGIAASRVFARFPTASGRF